MDYMQGEFDDEFYQKYNKDINTYIDHEGVKKCRMRNKICYDTKTQAKKARKNFELKYNHYFRVYLCDCDDKPCGYWHLSTTYDKFKKNT